VIRIGIGYDVHRIASGREMWLGGVRFEVGFGLEGHSDADVAAHALCDALLGAAALGDLGTHFPPGEARWRGASGGTLLGHVRELLVSAGWVMANGDITLICERPRIAPRVPDMRAALAAALRVEPAAISVKATTNERIGFIGRGEGIAAIAVATIESAR